MANTIAKKTVNILGATGSIGRSTLDVIKAHCDVFQINVLTAHSNVAVLAQQAIEFKASHAVIADKNLYQDLKTLLSGTNTQVHAGQDALVEAASINADITMAAIVGTAGLRPTLAAIRQGNTVAFASKECLVAAGQLMMDEVHKCGTSFLPVDSEHNAIFQVFEKDNKDAIKRLILTASGGPFRTWSKADMEKATPQQAIAHPTWLMGAKISVDSATLMNKALEVIEAVHLFGMSENKVDVIIHPQSLIHSMVEYNDGSILSQMGPSDMRTPITNCLAWPNRMQTSGPMMDLQSLTSLTFEQPDLDRFKSLALVRDVLKGDPAQAVIFNAANEIAVDAFLNNYLGFNDIIDTIQSALDGISSQSLKTLDDVIAYDVSCRKIVEENIKKVSAKISIK